MGATFALTESIVANTREKDDALNGAAGACAAGFLAGIRSKSRHSCSFPQTNRAWYGRTLSAHSYCFMCCIGCSDGHLRLWRKELAGFV